MAKKIRVADSLEERIYKGGLIPSTKEIAREYHVSYKTAYEAITELVDRKVAYRIPSKGAFPVPGSNVESKTVGVLWNHPDDLEKSRNSLISKEILIGINSAAALKGANIHHYFLENICVSNFKEPDCLIFLQGMLKLEKACELIKKLKCPHIYIGNWQEPEILCGSVCVDSLLAMKDALEYLSNRGLEKVALVHHDRPEYTFRSDCFRKAKAAMKMPHKEEWEINSGSMKNFVNAMQKGRDIGENIIANTPEVDAVLCISGHVAAGIYAKTLEVNSQLRVMEMDNIEGLGYYPLGEPALTSIAPDYLEMGKMAFEKLFGQEVESSLRSVFYLKAKILPRKSCGEF